MRLAALWFAALALAAPASAQRLDDHTILVPGGMQPGRQPDGNSVIFESSEGLVVFDTGRHASHTDAILAAAAGRPIVAIVNSHWHLDHISGNLRLRALFPRVTVWGTNAIDGALTGFLKTSAAQGRAALAAGNLPAGIAEDIRGDLATIDRGQALRPDVVVSYMQTMVVGALRLSVRYAPHAVTVGDIWMVDWSSRRVFAGDLVTLPAPFLDTACPEEWEKALDAIDKLNFDTLVPGHGPVMSHEDFRRWKSGFSDLLICTGGERPMETCAGGWLATARHFMSEDDVAKYADMAFYYGELLRSGALAKNCPA